MPGLASLADPWKREMVPSSSKSEVKVREKLFLAWTQLLLTSTCVIWGPRLGQPSEGLLTVPACPPPLGMAEGPKPRGEVTGNVQATDRGGGDDTTGTSAEASAHRM